MTEVLFVDTHLSCSKLCWTVRLEETKQTSLVFTVIISRAGFYLSRAGRFLHPATVPTSNTIIKYHALSIASKLVPNIKLTFNLITNRIHK